MGYFNMWRNAFNFKDSTPRGEYWGTVFINLIVAAALIAFNVYLAIGYMILSFIPMFSMTIRRINNTDHTPAVLLWLFVPLLGEIVIFFVLISQSRRDRDREFDKYHW